jgi:hypothetical protein
MKRDIRTVLRTEGLLQFAMAKNYHDKKANAS